MHGIEFVERAVYLPAADALVLTDLHVGRDASSSMTLPVGEREDLRDRLGAHIQRFRPDTVVFAGDVLHEFRGVSGATGRNLRELAELCESAGAEPVLLAGNHDPLLPSVWTGDVHDSVTLADDTVVCHGHQEPAAAGSRYMIGHEHPVIEIEGTRYPCFLRGDGAYRDADLLVLPSFTRLAPGVPVTRLVDEGFRSPLVTDGASLRPIVVDDEPLEFPPIRELTSTL